MDDKKMESLYKELIELYVEMFIDECVYADFIDVESLTKCVAKSYIKENTCIDMYNMIEDEIGDIIETQYHIKTF